MLFRSRQTINTKMRASLDLATDPWGIKVNRVEVKNIIPPREIQAAMEKQMKAIKNGISSSPFKKNTSIYKMVFLFLRTKKAPARKYRSLKLVKQQLINDYWRESL